MPRVTRKNQKTKKGTVDSRQFGDNEKASCENEK